MKLLAFNENWAIYSEEGKDTSVDPFSSLSKLLEINSYKRLTEFLETTAANKAFAMLSKNTFADWMTVEEKKKSIVNRNTVWTLKGSINKEIDRRVEIDLLDKLTIEELDLETCYEVSIRDILSFQLEVKKLLTLAAVAIGEKPPSGLFEEVETGKVFEPEYWTKNTASDIRKSRTFRVDHRKIPIDHHGYFESNDFWEDFQDYGKHQKDPEERGSEDIVCELENELGLCPPFPDSINNGLLFFTDEGHDENEDIYYATVTCMDSRQKSIEYAQKSLAGRIVKTVMNIGITIENSICFDPLLGASNVVGHEYEYDTQKGFSVEEESFLPFWGEGIIKEVFECILESRVSLCPVCGNPVVRRDNRGGGKEYCSRTCVTRASNIRTNKEICFTL